MLPVEILTEAVSFLPLYDLDSVLLANRQLSSIANKCVKGIRVWDFDYVFVKLAGDTIVLLTDDDTCHYFFGNRNVANVLDAALHNSRIKRLVMILSPVDVLRLPNKSALEIGELILRLHGVPSAENSSSI